MDVRVSVIIPCYNAKAWISDAIDSVLAQTYPHTEILVVDDGSTDGTSAYVQDKYANRVRYIAASHRGLSATRNLGLHHATGRYVQFLDADDMVLPTKMATHVAYLESHPGCTAVYSDCMVFHDGTPKTLLPWGREERYRSGDIFESLLGPGYLLIHMPLVRRDAIEKIGGFDEYMPTAEDRDFWLRLAWAGARFRFLRGEPLVLYRLRGDSMSNGRSEHALWDMYGIGRVRTYVKNPAALEALRVGRAVGQVRFVYGRAVMAEGRHLYGIYHMARGLIANQSDWNYKLTFLLLSAIMGVGRAERAILWMKRQVIEALDMNRSDEA